MREGEQIDCWGIMYASRSANLCFSVPSCGGRWMMKNGGLSLLTRRVQRFWIYPSSAVSRSLLLVWPVWIFGELLFFALGVAEGWSWRTCEYLDVACESWTWRHIYGPKIGERRRSCTIYLPSVFQHTMPSKYKTHINHRNNNSVWSSKSTHETR